MLSSAGVKALLGSPRGWNTLRRPGLWAAMRSMQTVAVTDARYLFHTADRDRAVVRRKIDDPQVVTELEVPDELVEQLRKGREELAELDDPGNTWVFGEEGELFEYDFVGTQLARSGVICLAPAAAAVAEEAVAPTSAWKAFSDKAMREKQVRGEALVPPLFFAGRIIGADSVAVYLYKRRKEVTGLMLVATW